jgi:hypothetical protein
MTMLQPSPGALIEVPCTIDLEHTWESVHAYVDLDGYEVGPGDEVLVLDAPAGIAHGEKRTLKGRAVIRRATPIERLKAILEGYLELTELYEVSFSPGRV